MRKIEISAFDLAQRYIGIKEVPGAQGNPAIMAMLTLDADWPQDDQTAWCSGFVNWIAWHLRLPRSKSLLARSWLGIGAAVQAKEAEVGFDVVVLQRGDGEQPGPENLTAAGHVGFFAGYDSEENGQMRIALLGGNQGDTVSVATYPINRVLGVRRLA